MLLKRGRLTKKVAHLSQQLDNLLFFYFLMLTSAVQRKELGVCPRSVPNPTSRRCLWAPPWRPGRLHLAVVSPLCYSLIVQLQTAWPRLSPKYFISKPIWLPFSGKIAVKHFSFLAIYFCSETDLGTFILTHFKIHWVYIPQKG